LSSTRIRASATRRRLGFGFGERQGFGKILLRKPAHLVVEFIPRIAGVALLGRAIIIRPNDVEEIGGVQQRDSEPLIFATGDDFLQNLVNRAEVAKLETGFVEQPAHGVSISRLLLQFRKAEPARGFVTLALKGFFDGDEFGVHDRGGRQRELQLRERRGLGFKYSLLQRDKFLAGEAPDVEQFGAVPPLRRAFHNSRTPSGCGRVGSRTILDSLRVRGLKPRGWERY